MFLKIQLKILAEQKRHFCIKQLGNKVWHLEEREEREREREREREF